VINFDENPQTAKIKIPAPAWETFGINTPVAQISGPVQISIEVASTLDYTDDTDLVIKVSPMNYAIYQMQEKQ